MTATTAPSTTRPFPAPLDVDLGRTVACLGDLHADYSWAKPRHDLAVADVTDRLLLNPRVPRFQLGDQNDASSTKDVDGIRRLGQYADGLPMYPVVGNHDITKNLRTPDQWAATRGLPAANYVVDLGWCRGIVLAPDGLTDTAGWAAMQPLSSSRLSWLADQAAAAQAAGVPAIVFCHWSLFDTVGTSPTRQPDSIDSTDAGFYAIPDAEIRDVLAAYPSIVAWISGHLHKDLDAVNAVTPATAGGRVVAAVNCGCMGMLDPYDPATVKFDRLFSLLVTYREDGTGRNVDVRWRDHARHAWTGPGTEKVATVTMVD